MDATNYTTKAYYKKVAERLFENEKHQAFFVDTANCVCFTTIAEAVIDEVEREINDDLDWKEEEEVFEAVSEWWESYPDRWRFNQ